MFERINKKKNTVNSRYGSLAIAAAILLVFSMFLHGCQLRDLETTMTDTSSESTKQTTQTTEQSSETTDEESSDTASQTSSETETTKEESSSTSETTTAKPTTKATTKSTTTKATTAKKTTTTTTTTAAPKPSGGNFPYKNYGAYFRDNYGSNANHVVAEYEDIIKITLDVGSTPNGVALLKVDKLPTNVQCIVQLKKDGSMYQYHFNKRGTWVGIPLQMGNGSYTIYVAFKAGDGSFPAPMVHTFKVSLASGLKPYTASSIIADFSRGSSAVSTASSLTSGQSTLDGKIDAVYNWITKNISYNRSLASQITNGSVTSYLPNPDKTMSSRTGICYDYASLMCAMLRSQGIATRMIHGSTPQGYHAWNEVYMDGQGWVVVAGFSWSELGGASWVRFDTTFAAGGMSSKDIKNNSYSATRYF